MSLSSKTTCQQRHPSLSARDPSPLALHISGSFVPFSHLRGTRFLNLRNRHSRSATTFLSCISTSQAALTILQKVAWWRSHLHILTVSKLRPAQYKFLNNRHKMEERLRIRCCFMMSEPCTSLLECCWPVCSAKTGDRGLNV